MTHTALDLGSLLSWLETVLKNPGVHYADERVAKLHHNLFAFRDFETNRCTREPIFQPRSECTIHVTPLSAAAYCGNEKAVEVLLKHHDPHDDPDNVWVTPLTLAYISHNARIVTLLKEHERERDENHTPFTVMHAAAKVGSTSYFHELLTVHWVETTIRDMDGITPVVHALYEQDDEKVKEMITAIIERNHLALDIKDIWINDWTCVDLARAMRKSGDLVKWLWRAQRWCARAERTKTLHI